MTSRFPGIILSGGRSSRMGEPKALLPFGQARLIDHVAGRLAPQVSYLLLNSNDPRIALAGSRSVPDRFQDFPGPLAGIHAGLAHVAEHGPPTSHLATVAVDAPFFPSDLFVRLEAALTGPDDVALATSLGRQHPVMGLWPISALGPLSVWLADPPTLRVRAFLETLPVVTVDFPAIETSLGPIDPFLNINTVDDLQRARAVLALDGTERNGN